MDLQLNISTSKNISNKREKSKKPDQQSSGFNFVSKPVFAGKALARKRHIGTIVKKQDNGPTVVTSPPKKQKLNSLQPNKFQVSQKNVEGHLQDRNTIKEIKEPLKDTSKEFKRKGHEKPFESVGQNSNHKPGVWITSLFKNNPDVPHIGQRAVKPLTEKVFSGKNFSDLNIHKHSIANLEQNLKLTELMTVQQKASPIILQGRDVLIRSQTGSGKTLAYALPIVEGLQAIRPKINRHNGIRCVVVVPTRELAVQTFELFVKLVKPFTWVVPGLLSGGQKRKAEKARLRKGLNILIGTPGRICDHLRQTKSLNFAQTRCLVLDEADRLLDMGYEKDVSTIVKSLDDHKSASTYDPMALVKKQINKKTIFEKSPTALEKVEVSESEQNPETHPLTDIFNSDRRQTILLSATLTKAVKTLAGLTMVDPVFVDTSEGRTPTIADSLIKAVEVKPKAQPKVSHKEKKSSKSSISITDSKIADKKAPKPAGNGIGLPKSLLPDQESDSDSGSDYDYYRAHNDLEPSQGKSEPLKEESPKGDIDESTDETIETPSSFQDALQNALIEDELILPASVKQNFIITPMKLRLVTLCSIIVRHCVLNQKGGKMVVFVATQDMVDYHCELLQAVLTGAGLKNKKKIEKMLERKTKEESNRIASKDKSTNSDSSHDEENEEFDDVDSDFEVDLPGEYEGAGLVPVQIEFFKLHGSMPHQDRMDVFNEFRTTRSGVLFCTDVAARGLDLPKVDLVLQYCVPCSATDYVHRVGRTGRAANVGAATMLLLPSESEFVRYLESKRVRLKQEDDKDILEPLCTLAPGQHPQRAAIALQDKLERMANSSQAWLEQASKAYTSWVRFYRGYPRAVREHLDSRQLHLGHAAKAFALRDTPGEVARRLKSRDLTPDTPSNRLTVDKGDTKDRKSFKPNKMDLGQKFRKTRNHMVSEFDSGLEATRKRKKKI